MSECEFEWVCSAGPRINQEQSKRSDKRMLGCSRGIHGVRVPTKNPGDLQRDAQDGGMMYIY